MKLMDGATLFVEVTVIVIELVILYKISQHKDELDQHTQVLEAHLDDLESHTTRMEKSLATILEETEQIYQRHCENLNNSN